MPARDVWDQLEALLRRVHNVKPREIRRVAEKAGWRHQNTTGSHATYVKNGFPHVLTIKLHHLGGDLARRLLRVIESSLYEEERESHDNQEGG